MSEVKKMQKKVFRIGLVASSFLPVPGGLEWKVHYLAEEYYLRGHIVTVFAGRAARRYWGPVPVPHHYRVLRVGLPPFPGAGRLRLTALVASLQMLMVYQRQGLDVLHSHHIGEPTDWALRLKRRTGVPVVATTCGDDAMMPPDPKSWTYRKDPQKDKIVRRNLQLVDIVGSVSRSIRQELEALGTRAKIVDIPNGVDWDQFQGADGTPFRTRLSVSPANPLIVSLGRYHRDKDYETGLCAFKLLNQEMPQCRYAIVGANTRQLKPLVAKLGLEGLAHLVEAVPMSEVPVVLNSADLFFSPSRREGFAQVVVQAMACGRACVLSDCPGNDEFKDHPAVLLARAGDASHLAEALRRLVTDSSRRQSMAKMAHEHSRRYAWSRIAEQYLANFEELLGA